MSNKRKSKKRGRDIGSDPAILAFTGPNGWLANHDPPAHGAKGSNPICACQRVDVNMEDLATFEDECKQIRLAGEGRHDDEEKAGGEEVEEHDGEDISEDEKEESDGLPEPVINPPKDNNPKRQRVSVTERRRLKAQARLEGSGKYFTNESLEFNGPCCSRNCHDHFSHQQILAFRHKYHRVSSQVQGRTFILSRFNVRPQDEENMHGR